MNVSFSLKIHKLHRWQQKPNNLLISTVFSTIIIIRDIKFMLHITNSPLYLHRFNEVPYACHNRHSREITLFRGATSTQKTFQINFIWFSSFFSLAFSRSTFLSHQIWMKRLSYHHSSIKHPYSFGSTRIKSFVISHTKRMILFCFMLSSLRDVIRFKVSKDMFVDRIWDLWIIH